jgi:hypothetical protein
LIEAANQSSPSALLKIKKCREKALFSSRALGGEGEIDVFRKYESLKETGET